MSKNIVLGIVVALLFVGGFWWLFSMRTDTQDGSMLNNSTSNSAQTNENVGLANPASVNCAKVGGTTQIMNGPNGQYGLCNFDDAYACEEWALFRGECPVGGVRTTGFDTIEQKYCAWVGGQTLAVPNAQCTLPGGKVCSDVALYNGQCNSTE